MIHTNQELTLSFPLIEVFWLMSGPFLMIIQFFFDICVTDLFVFSIPEKMLRINVWEWFFNFTYFYLFFIEFLTKTALSWSFIRLGDFFSFPNKFPIIFVKDVRNIFLVKINWIHLTFIICFSCSISWRLVFVNRLARKFKIYTTHCAPPRPDHHPCIFW